MKKSIISMILVFAVLAFFVSCGGSEGSGDGEASDSRGIYGHVTDYDTGEPIANATVSLSQSGERALTGSDGYFEFRELTGSHYTIWVSKTGYCDFHDNLDADYGRMLRFDVNIGVEEYVCDGVYCCGKGCAANPSVDPPCY